MEDEKLEFYCVERNSHNFNIILVLTYSYRKRNCIHINFNMSVFFEKKKRRELHKMSINLHLVYINGWLLAHTLHK